GTVVDGMWKPDFSQVESDDFQPTANNQFALLFPEKRPFFLESKNLLSTPLQAIYTRSIGEPRWGARLTQQLDGANYTLLASRDRGGGGLIEPGLLSSSVVEQPGESTATLGRFQSFAGDWRIGGLFTYRKYQDDSHNLVAGPDILWTPSSSDRVRAQYLVSATRNPERPDLYAGWLGQSLHDHAAYLDWSHVTDTWNWDTTYQHLGRDFRAWEGFMPQVDIVEYDGSLGYGFYPASNGWINNLTPQLLLTRTDDDQGNLVLRSFAPSLAVNGAQSSTLQLNWYPDDRQLTPAGLVHLRYSTLSFSSNPNAHFTYFSTSLRLGEDVDYLTGDKGHGPQFRVKLQVYPVDRLELDLVDSYQYLNAQTPLSGNLRLFSERGTQLRALWFFTSRVYTELSAERDVIHRNLANYASPVNHTERNSLYTLLFAYEPTPWTHFYAGYRKSDAQTLNQPLFDGNQTQVFVKMAYEFAM
ncbi:MAG TPA: hypothetical protein VFM15_02405, partial [Gammaproteobacteria bacterium]|nr:hypothetical protein [Gammaproteobacteria bacterium]